MRVVELRKSRDKRIISIERKDLRQFGNNRVSTIWIDGSAWKFH